jgi:chromosome segregation ATPase
MLLTKRFRLCGLLCLICVIAPVAGLAQTDKATEPARDGERQVLQALLKEVRELRLALQRMNLSAYRAQIVVERIRAQNGRIERLSQELEMVRREMEGMDDHLPRLKEMLKELEQQVSREGDGPRRAELEMQYKAIKAEMEEQPRRQQRQRDREAQLLTQLQTEQTKLDVLNDRLESLERDLELEQPGDNSQPAGKRP